ncbi:hypothetical protein E4U54_006388, partial [Claviceps lovelessii]
MSPVAQCDGLRPKCSNCQGKNAPCEYRDDGDLSKESKEVILEMTRTLTQLPATSRMRILQELADESNAWTILSTLRQKAADYRQDPNDASASTMSSTDDETCDLTQNWESQNPVAYPDREVLEPNMTQLQQLTRLSAQQPELSPCQMQSDWANIETETAASGPPHASESESTGEGTLCDERLSKLNIRYWTSIDISDDLAARCISLYLKTDHPLLGHFDPELFVSHLISEEHEYCSALLINSMLYWACMYSAIDPKTDALATEFCAEAEILWTAERELGHDSALTLAAAVFLCMGYLGQGRDHAVLKYLAEATNMAGRMGLFSSEAQTGHRETRDFLDLTGAPKAAYMYAAWGIFNWLT